jgi:hypothetical protein
MHRYRASRRRGRVIEVHRSAGFVRRIAKNPAFAGERRLARLVLSTD